MPPDRAMVVPVAGRGYKGECREQKHGVGEAQEKGYWEVLKGKGCAE